MSTNLAEVAGRIGPQFHHTVAANVRAEMARLDITQAQIAGALGITQQSVSAKRKGQTPFTLNELATIAPILRTTVAALVLPRLDSNQQPAD